VIAPERTTIRGVAALPYLPEIPPHATPPVSTFAAGEQAEFREGNLRRASAVYAALARSPEAAVRAGALARLARVQRRLKDVDGALATYAGLETVGEGVHAVGYPASLTAALGRMSALAENGRADAARASAESLAADLARGRWALQRSEFQAHLQAAEEAGAATALLREGEGLALAEALDWLWTNRHTLQDTSRQTVRTTAGPALLVWQRNTDRWTAAVGPPAFVAALCPMETANGVRCVITDVDGQAVSGAPFEARVRTETRTVPGLPWTVHFQIEADAAAGRTAVNRQALTMLFVALGIVLALGWYFILRSISREIRTSRMQTDFVAAVSHEFRTPLTSLAHISQMLAEERVSSEPLRTAAYGTLVRETDRLRRLVESLLEFGRFEAGGVQLRMEPTDAAALVGEVVREYEDPLRGSRRVIRLSLGPGPATVRADRDALARVVWNLLDNAVKYSSDGADVEVLVSRSRDAVSIAVRDRGIGIPAHEQREIFQRFVRGAESKARRIKGTGIGLALVQQIVRAPAARSLSFFQCPGDRNRPPLRPSR
jgi:signal transduction histidine kinase